MFYAWSEENKGEGYNTISTKKPVAKHTIVGFSVSIKSNEAENWTGLDCTQRECVVVENWASFTPLQQMPHSFIASTF
jgi:hypothetical protein